MDRRWMLVVLLGLSLGMAVGTAAQELPMLVQPQDAGFSSTQRASLGAAIGELQRLFRSHDLGSRQRLGDGGWSAEQFAAYTAGTLERLGYVAGIVSRAPDHGTDPSAAWVAVRVDVGEGASAWIPVNPTPGNPELPQSRWGAVPLLDGGELRYETAYLSYDRVIELPPNQPPTAVIWTPAGNVAEKEMQLWSSPLSRDPDGKIVLYQWTFGRDVLRVSGQPSVFYTFDRGGEQVTVTLTVTDSRGAQGTETLTVYVMTEDEAAHKPCGACG
jgi:hypothetical protein